MKTATANTKLYQLARAQVYGKGELKWQVRCINQGAPLRDLHVSLEERPTSAHRTLALNNEQQETYSVSLHIVKSNKVKSLHL